MLKLSMALIRPMHPTWNRSSTFSPRLENFMDHRQHQPQIAGDQLLPGLPVPALARRRSAWVSSFFSTFSCGTTLNLLFF